LNRTTTTLTLTVSMEFRYFFMRKLWFAYLARSLVVFPGGFGTLDELTEILTLVQTRKLAQPIPVILYGTSYWNEIINFQALVRHGMIESKDLELFEYADDPVTAFAVLQSKLQAEPVRPVPASPGREPRNRTIADQHDCDRVVATPFCQSPI
jgi:uncharacterized protein (TIGR00730 family)